MAQDKELAVATLDESNDYARYFTITVKEIFDQGQPEEATVIKFITKYKCDVISTIEECGELVWAIPRKNLAYGCICLHPETSIKLSF